jgi:hypothetical protein
MPLPASRNSGGGHESEHAVRGGHVLTADFWGQAMIYPVKLGGSHEPSGGGREVAFTYGIV